MGLQVPVLTLLLLHYDVHRRLWRHNPKKRHINPDNLYGSDGWYDLSYAGIINIGYVINEVGRFLFKINESQDQMYQDISDA